MKIWFFTLISPFIFVISLDDRNTLGESMGNHLFIGSLGFLFSMNTVKMAKNILTLFPTEETEEYL